MYNKRKEKEKVNYNFFHSDVDQDLQTHLEKLNCNFIKYKHEIRKYFNRCYNNDTTNKVSWSNRLPKDEINLMIDRLTPFIDSPENIEAFHKLIIFKFRDYLSTKVNTFENKEEFLKSKSKISSKIGKMKQKDNFLEISNLVQNYLLEKIKKKTMELLVLYDEERREEFMRQKKFKRFVNMIGAGKLNNKKMSLGEQLKQTEHEREELIEVYKLLRFDPDEELKDGLNFSNKKKKMKKNHFENFLNKFKDRKDYIISLLEDYSLNAIGYKIMREHKSYKLTALNDHLRTLPELIYARDFSYNIQTYHSNFFIFGGDYEKTKNIPEMKKNPNKFISQNFLDSLIRKSGALNYKRYKSNQYFDNLSMSVPTIDTFYHSFSLNTPYIVLILKNLENRFIDEIDVFEDLIFENPFELRLSALREIAKEFNETLTGGFIKDRSFIYQHLNKRISKDSFLEIAFKKYETSPDKIYDLQTSIDSYFTRVYDVQTPYFVHVDFIQRQNLMDNGSLRFKLNDEKNPNKKLLDRINSLDAKSTFGVKKIDLNDPYIIKEILLDQKELKELEDVSVSQLINNFISTIMLDDISVTHQKVDSYLDFQLTRMKENEKKFRKGKNEKKTQNFEIPEMFGKTAMEIEKSYYKLMTLASRNNLVRLITYMNYFTSIQLRMNDKIRTLEKTEENTDDITKLRRSKKKKPKEKSDKNLIKDDTFIEGGSHLEPKAPRSGRYATLNKKRSYQDMGSIEEEDNDKDEDPSQTKLNEIDQEFIKIDDSLNDSLKDLSMIAQNFNSLKRTLTKGVYEKKSSFRSGASSKADSSGYTQSFLTLKEKLDRERRNEEYFDMNKTEGMSGKFFMKKKNENFLVKVTDSKGQEILYDKALKDFETIISTLKKLASYFIEHNLIDFCFDSVEIEDFKLEDNRGFTHKHMKMNITELVKSINIEYIMHKVFKAETEFQAAKVRTIETVYSMMDHMSDQKSVLKLIKMINSLILKRPDLDLENFVILNDTLREVCNNRVNQTDINVASLRKEIHNHVLTIFDNYEISTKYLIKYNNLLKKFIKEQNRISRSCEITKELKNVMNIFLRKTQPFVKIEDNLDMIMNFDENIEDGIVHLMENLLDFESIDKLTLTDQVVEENNKEYLKSMNIKILDLSKKISTTILGKGIKQVTTINFLRLFIRNQLVNNKGFIKSNLRILFLNEILKIWAEIDEGFSQDLLKSQSTRMVSNIDSRQKMFGNALSNLLLIKSSLQNEKRKIILTSQDDQWEILRSKSSYLKSEFRERVEILNSIHLVNLFLTNQIEIRKLLDSLSLTLEIHLHQKNNHKVKTTHFNCDSQEKIEIIKEIFKVGDNLTTKLSCLQRVLKFDVMSCWEPDSIKRNISLIADSKAFFDLISIFSIFFKYCVFTNNLTNRALVNETVENLSNIFSIKQLAEKVISNLNITFKSQEQSNHTQSSHSSFAIYKDDPVYITNRIKASGTEILYSSKNESLVRRLLLHSLYEKLPKYFIDAPVRFARTKERVFLGKGDQVSLRKVNYTYEKKLKPVRRKTMRGGKKDKKDDEKKRKRVESYKFENCQKLSELLVYLRRETFLVSNHLDTLKCYGSMENSVAPYSSWFQVFTRNVPFDFKLENINRFFWMAVSNKEIEHTFLSEEEIRKGFLEAVDSISETSSKNSEILFNVYPGFMKNFKINEIPETTKNRLNTQSTQSDEPVIPPFHHLKNIDELNSMLRKDSVELLRKEIYSFEQSFLTKVIISDLSLPKGLFIDKTEIGAKKETSLSKLLGRSSKKKSSNKSSNAKTKKFNAEKYERISAYAKNYYNNSLDYVLEQILLNSALFNQPKEKEPVEIETSLELVSHLKFRTNMKGAIMEEDKKNIVLNSPIWLKNHKNFVKMMREFESVNYNSYIHQIKLLVKIYIMLVDLKSKNSKAKTKSLPTWILKHVKSTELELIYNRDEIKGLKHETEVAGLKEMSLKILDIDNINKINSEHDIYSNQNRHKIESNIISYMKERGLYSINYSQNSNNNSLRNCDLRLRVFFYEVTRYERQTLEFFYDIRNYLLNYYHIDSRDALEILRKKTTIIQNELVLSIFDLIFRLTWSYETNSNRDNRALKAYKELLEILKEGSHPLDYIKDLKICPHRDSLKMRNLDIHNFFIGEFTKEIDVLNYMNKPHFQIGEDECYIEGFGFLESKTKFEKISKWIEKNDIFMNLLLHNKIKSSEKNWVFYEGRVIKSLFQTAQPSREGSSYGEEGFENSNIMFKDNIRELKKREEILNVLIKNCDLIDFLSDNLGKQGLELEIDKEKIKSLSNRNNLSHNVKIRKLENKIDPEYLAHFFKNFMLDMIIHYQIVKNKNEDVKEAIKMYKSVTRKPVKSGLSVESFDHYYHLDLNLPSIMLELEEDKSNYIENLRAMTRKEDSEVMRYVKKRLDCTFLVPETEQIISNLGYILKLCIKRIVNQKKEILGLRSIFFKRVNENMEARLIEQKQSRRSLYGSVKTLNPFSPVKQKKTSFEDVTLTKKIFEMEKDRYLPFLLKAYQSLMDGSFSIITKSKEKHMIINKNLFVKILGIFVHEMCVYYQNLDSELIKLYRKVIDKENSKLVIRDKEVEKMTEKFSDFVENFHKHIESKMAELNFQTIYDLDQFAKLIKYTHYDTSVNYDNMHERISQKFDDELVKLLLLRKQLEDRLMNYKKGMTLEMKEFVSEKYNENMVEVRKKIEKILKEEINLVDKGKQDIISDKEILEILDDEKLTKIELLNNKMRLRFRKILVEQQQENYKSLQNIQQKISIDENMLKKIRELKRREVKK